MIARFEIDLPFGVTFFVEEDYPIFENQYGDYVVRFLPMKTSEELESELVGRSEKDASKALINDSVGIHTDVLCLEFEKDEFDPETEGHRDPPNELVETVVNNFLGSLRYVSEASCIRSLSLSDTGYFLEYLNSGETKFPRDELLARMRGHDIAKYSWMIITKEMWNDAHSIENPSELPAWSKLLLDAHFMMPECGPAIILAFTALEVFVSTTLNDIAERGKIDKNLWDWINDRGGSGIFKEPTIAEKFDVLAGCLIGKSLKEDNGLWESFINLKKARNSFAHHGIPKIDGKEVNQQTGYALIKEAKKIIQFFRNGLPEELLWPEYKYNFTYTLHDQVFESRDDTSRTFTAHQRTNSFTR